jgi:hypothetical protein
MGLFGKRKTKEEIEQERIALEQSKREKEYKAKMLINKTKNDLQKTVDKLGKQKSEFLEIAKQAKAINDNNGFRSAYVGWKVSHSSQKRANMMLIKLNLTEQMKEIGEISKHFSESMVHISKQLADITKNTDYLATERNFTEAMDKINESEVYLEHFFENMDDTLDAYSSTQEGSSHTIDKEFLELVDQSLMDSELKDLEKAQANLNPGESTDAYLSKKLAEMKKKLDDV